MLKKVLSLLFFVGIIVLMACGVNNEEVENGTEEQSYEKLTDSIDTTVVGERTEIVEGSETAEESEAVEEQPHPAPPGTLPLVSEIPQPDQRRVGTIETFSLLNSGETYFFYMYESKTREERLILFEGEPTMYKGMGLVVLKTSFGGWNGLRESLFDKFQATILANVNLSIEESQYVYNTSYRVGDCKEEEILSAEQYFEETEHVLFVIGRVNPDRSVLFLANTDKTESDALKKKSNVYRRIIERFELTEFCLSF